MRGASFGLVVVVKVNGEYELTSAIALQRDYNREQYTQKRYCRFLSDLSISRLINLRIPIASSGARSVSGHLTDIVKVTHHS